MINRKEEKRREERRREEKRGEERRREENQTESIKLVRYNTKYNDNMTIIINNK